MMYCSQCGAQIDVSARFCQRCGQRNLAQDHEKICQKCNALIESGVLYCRNCGTKQYVSQQYQQNDEQLVFIPNCKLVKIGFLKNEGALKVCGKAVAFIAQTPAYSIELHCQDIVSVVKHTTLSEALCIKLTNKNGKGTVIALPPCEADFIAYLILLIADLTRQAQSN